jgi:hypothetical protein
MYSRDGNGGKRNSFKQSLQLILSIDNRWEDFKTFQKHLNYVQHDKILHHAYSTITLITFQINQPTRCKNFSSLLLDVYVQLNMFRASSRPSSGAQQLQ